MTITDRRFIEFLAKSPIKSFETMADALGHLKGAWIWEDLEYELFANADGIRLPRIKGIADNALLAFTSHTLGMHLVRRRVRIVETLGNGQTEALAVFELTSAGEDVARLLDALVEARSDENPKARRPKQPA